MSAVTLGDVKQAAAIIGANITDFKERETVARQFAALFSARFYTFDTREFLNRVERASDNPQDYEFPATDLRETRHPHERQPMTDTKPSITIRHKHSDGTLIEGSSKGDGVFEILRGLRGPWWYSRSLGCLYLKHSRDQIAKRYVIGLARDALEAAGYPVTVEIDNDATRTVAEAEADRAGRAEDRAEWHEDAAERASGRADSHYDASHKLVENIPFGQPILVGHHSERGHRRTLDRSWAHMGKSVAEGEKAEYHEGRAESAAKHMQHRESVPTTLRRINGLEADARRIQRELDGRLDYVWDEEAGRSKLKLVKPGEQRREDLAGRLRDVNDQITYWKKHVAEQEAAGVKVWGKTDFEKGDFVFFIASWYEVQRVNAKSVTIPAMISGGLVVTKESGMSWTDTIPYDKVKGKKTAAEIAKMLAEKKEDSA